MSLQSPEAAPERGAPSKLIIQDQPYQFLPNLAAVYGDSCALIVQQLFYKIEVAPYFEGEELPIEEYDGLKWIQIYGFMWWDTLEGICRHLPRSTFYTYRKSLVKNGALKVRDTLGTPERVVYSSKKDEGASWYALDHRIIAEHDKRYREEFDTLREARREARRWLHKNKGKDAHWRPAPGEDTSKQIAFCRELNAELCAELELVEEAPVPLPSVRKPRGKHAPKAHSQFENGRVSPDSTSENLDFSLPEQPHSQNENGGVSPDSHSQIENECILKLRMETSQNENDADSILKLRIAPYIDKTGTKTESLDSTTEDTPAALLPANADVVVKNIRSLSGTPSNTNEKPAVQMSLREILATLLSQPVDAAEKLATRFQEIAGEKHQLDCPDEIAARVVACFPIAILDEMAVKRLIGADRAEIGLESPIGGAERKSLLEDVDELRWQIFAWPSHRAEVEAYYARKKEKPRLAGAFLTKWREETPPSRGWMTALIDEAKHALRSETTARQQAQADAAWAELSPGQQRALDEEVFARVVVSGMGGSVDANKARVKRQLLNDSQFLAGLEDAEPTPQIEAAKMARELESPKPASAYSPNRVELEKMAFHAEKLARNVRSGQYDLDGAEDDAIGRLFYGPAAAGYLRGMIETLLNASDEVKAA